jgi:hypothetical protein
MTSPQWGHWVVATGGRYSISGSGMASRIWYGGLLLALVACLSCRSTRMVSAPVPESPAACAARLQTFTEFVRALPTRTVASAARGDLPVSTLGALPGPGPVLDISGNAVTLDGEPIRGSDLEARARGFRHLYVAAAADADVQTVRAALAPIPTAVELRLLVRTPAQATSSSPRQEPRVSDDPATRLLLEADPREREKIAAEGYARLADCAALTLAVSSVRGQGARQRWPALQVALGSALPRCDCGKVDTARLQQLVAAEQRASGATLAWVPLSFLRDERCGASMPLRSLKKLIQQIEGFDAQFAGGWQHDALKFTDVVNNDRLRVYFCNALPGETLAAKERARGTLYLRVPGAGSCDPWQFEPLSPGAPMGTWRRLASASRAALAFHYWQAAEEIRVFGPIDAVSPSRPTDTRDWACEETHRLTGIDEDSIELDTGRWFFDEAACRRVSEESGRPAPCVARPPNVE